MTESHIVLELVIGVPKAPGDPYSNEPELEVINLLNVAGFAVEYPDGWVPQMPVMKGGGLWADSALSAGRQLIAGELGNVVETITLTATGATLQTFLFLKSRLLEFGRRARAFHTDWAEQQPCYLKWHAPGGACPQYALVYAIDTAGEEDAFEGNRFDTVVITVEREPAWRMGVPPGGNPMLWTYFSRNQNPGINFDYDDMELNSSSSLIADTSVVNRHEWTYNAGNPVTTPTSKNYVSISASQVPGDAPALASIVVESTQPGIAREIRRLLVWHSSKDQSGVNQVNGLPMASAYIMNVGDMGWVTGSFTAGVVGNAVFNTAAVPARQYRTGTLPLSGDLMTGQSDTGINTFWRRQLLRGRFAVFARALVLTGTLGDVKLQAIISELSDSGSSGLQTVTLPEVNVPIVGGAAGTGQYFLIYLGQVTLPFESKAHIGLDGRNIYLKNTSPTDLRVTFRFRNATSPSASRTVEMLDGIMVPIDEAFAELRSSTGTATQTFFLDNTGYIGRGDQRDMAGVVSGASVGVDTPYHTLELRGNAPMLLPRTDQQIGFVAVEQSETSRPDRDLDVYVNIVPRCYGVAAL